MRSPVSHKFIKDLIFLAYSFRNDSNLITFEDCFCGIPNHIGAASFIKKYQLLFGQRMMQLVKSKSMTESKLASEEAKVTYLKHYISQKLQFSHNLNFSFANNQSSQSNGLKAETNLGIIYDELKVSKSVHIDNNSIKSEYANCSIDQSSKNDIEYERANLSKIDQDCLSSTAHLQLLELNDVIKKNSKFTQLKENISYGESS